MPPLPRPSGTRCTPRSRRPPTARSILTGAHGTGHRRRLTRMRPWQRTWSARPPVHRPAEGSPRPPPFLERAATLTPEPALRVQRLIAAARAKRDAGALEAATNLLTAAEAGSLSALQAAEVDRLRGRAAFDQRRAGEAARLLVSAAKRAEPLDLVRARETYLEALGA